MKRDGKPVKPQKSNVDKNAVFGLLFGLLCKEMPVYAGFQ